MEHKINKILSFKKFRFWGVEDEIHTEMTMAQDEKC